MEHVKVGIIGCGNISDVYMKNLRCFPWVSLEACADLISERAREKALAHGIPRVMTVEEMLIEPTIALIINLTWPQSHSSLA